MFGVVPQSRSVFPGELVVLECEVDATPPASIEWLREGQVLPPCQENVTTLPCMLSQTVMLQEASEEAEGQYACMAENQHGTALHEITLTLTSPASEFRGDQLR